MRRSLQSFNILPPTGNYNMGVLRVNNSLSQANDCEEKGKVSKALSMCRKSRPLDFRFTKNLSGASKHNF